LRGWSQSVPRDGGYCNNSLGVVLRRLYVSQSVPRDGGYCNSRYEWGSGGVLDVSIRPEGRGVLQRSCGR